MIRVGGGVDNADPARIGLVIHKLIDLIKAIRNVPSGALDAVESKHVKAASELVQKIKPDVILLNICTPGLDGEALFARAGNSASLNGMVQLLTLPVAGGFELLSFMNGQACKIGNFRHDSELLIFISIHTDGQQNSEKCHGRLLWNLLRSQAVRGFCWHDPVPG